MHLPKFEVNVTFRLNSRTYPGRPKVNQISKALRGLKSNPTLRSGYLRLAECQGVGIQLGMALYNKVAVPPDYSMFSLEFQIAWILLTDRNSLVEQGDCGYASKSNILVWVLHTAENQAFITSCSLVNNVMRYLS